MVEASQGLNEQIGPLVGELVATRNEAVQSLVQVKVIVPERCPIDLMLQENKVRATGTLAAPPEMASQNVYAWPF